MNNKLGTFKSATIHARGVSVESHNCHAINKAKEGLYYDV